MSKALDNEVTKNFLIGSLQKYKNSWDVKEFKREKRRPAMYGYEVRTQTSF